MRDRNFHMCVRTRRQRVAVFFCRKKKNPTQIAATLLLTFNLLLLSHSPPFQAPPSLSRELPLRRCWLARYLTAACTGRRTSSHCWRALLLRRCSPTRGRRVPAAAAGSLHSARKRCVLLHLVSLQRRAIHVRRTVVARRLAPRLLPLRPAPRRRPLRRQFARCARCARCARSWRRGRQSSPTPRMRSPSCLCPRTCTRLCVVSTARHRAPRSARILASTFHPGRTTSKVGTVKRRFWRRWSTRHARIQLLRSAAGKA